MANSWNLSSFLLTASVLLAAGLFGLHTWASMPVVEFSHSTKRCVRVIANTSIDCTQLPHRYKAVWVK